MITFVFEGWQEVPAVSTLATGSGVFSVGLDSRLLYYNIVSVGLSGRITGAQIRLGKAGMNGGIVVDLSSGISADGRSVSGVVATNDNGFIAKLDTGAFYVELQTAAHPAGEIRGSVFNNTFLVPLDARLDTAQMVNGGVSLKATSSGLGVAYFEMGSSLDSLQYDIRYSNLTGAVTSAHFHNAAAGKAGSVVFSISLGDHSGQLTGCGSG